MCFGYKLDYLFLLTFGTEHELGGVGAVTVGAG
jgi:hypothetical protein